MRFSALLGLAGAALALTLTACPGRHVPPYYQFTAADREWMTFQPGAVWTFENGKGARNRFRIDSARTREHRTEYSRTFTGRYTTDPDFYYDDYLLRVHSLDSARHEGSFALTCRVPTGVSGTVLSAANSEWTTFIGADAGSGYVPQWLPFPADLRQAGFQELTVGGRRYSRVLALRAVGPSIYSAGYGLRTTVRQLYYDQQAGVVRLVEDSGEVWNRVP